MAAGKLISLEGIEGAGKSTVVALMAGRLRECGVSVVDLREPGSTAAGEALRVLLKDGTIQLSPLTEAFLFEAARHELVEQQIRPALAAGKWVIADRFYDSTTAYQGYGRGLDPAMLKRMHRYACGDTVPDLTLFLDVEPAVGLRRTRATGTCSSGAEPDRFEKAGEVFLAQVRRGFLAVAQEEPDRVVVVPVTAGISEMVERCLNVVEQRFGGLSPQALDEETQ